MGDDRVVFDVQTDCIRSSPKPIPLGEGSRRAMATPRPGHREIERPIFDLARAAEQATCVHVRRRGLGALGGRRQDADEVRGPGLVAVEGRVPGLVGDEAGKRRRVGEEELHPEGSADAAYTVGVGDRRHRVGGRRISRGCRGDVARLQPPVGLVADCERRAGEAVRAGDGEVPGLVRDRVIDDRPQVVRDDPADVRAACRGPEEAGERFTGRR